MKKLKHINRFKKSDENLDSSKKLNEGKNSFNNDIREGVNIGESLKIYFDKEINKLCYKYPGRGWNSEVNGIFFNEDIDDLINLLQKYKK